MKCQCLPKATLPVHECVDLPVELKPVGAAGLFLLGKMVLMCLRSQEILLGATTVSQRLQLFESKMLSA